MAKKKAEKKKRTRLVVSEIDWKKPTSVIAAETGKGAPFISRLRRRYAPDTIRAFVTHHSKGGRPKLFDFQNVDWSLRNREISKLTGAPPTFVSKYRRIYAPHTLRTYHPKEEEKKD